MRSKSSRSSRISRVVEQQSSGVVQQWSSVVVEQWSSGVVEQWSSGVVEQWSSGVVEQWNSGVVEQWSSGVVEQWSSEVVEQWSRGIVSVQEEQQEQQKQQWSKTQTAIEQQLVEKRNYFQAQISGQEGFPTAEEFVICNKELNLMAKISFQYGKHRQPFTGESLMLLLLFQFIATLLLIFAAFCIQSVDQNQSVLLLLLLLLLLLRKTCKIFASHFGELQHPNR